MVTEHFNGLQEGEAERLAYLIEECGELIQAAAKILRHGYNSWHPDTGVGNRDQLQKEMGDVRVAMIDMCAAGDVSKEYIHTVASEKLKGNRRWMHHQQT